MGLVFELGSIVFFCQCLEIPCLKGLQQALTQVFGQSLGCIFDKYRQKPESYCDLN